MDHWVHPMDEWMLLLPRWDPSNFGFGPRALITMPIRPSTTIHRSSLIPMPIPPKHIPLIFTRRPIATKPPWFGNNAFNFKANVFENDKDVIIPLTLDRDPSVIPCVDPSTKCRTTPMQNNRSLTAVPTWYFTIMISFDIWVVSLQNVRVHAMFGVHPGESWNTYTQLDAPVPTAQAETHWNPSTWLVTHNK